MGLLELVPDEYLAIKKEVEFLAWLRALDWPSKYKKYALVEWAQVVGVTLTGDMVTRGGIRE